MQQAENSDMLMYCKYAQKTQKVRSTRKLPQIMFFINYSTVRVKIRARVFRVSAGSISIWHNDS